MRAVIKQYAMDTRGNYALIFAGILFPLIMSVGVAIDHSRLTRSHIRLQSMADTAALAAAKKHREEYFQTLTKAKKAGQESFYANASVQQDFKIDDIEFSLSEDGASFDVTAEASLNPIFMQIFGYPKFDMTVNSSASLGKDLGAEIVIALDGTNSMTFDNRWETAMDTVEDLLEDMQELTGSNDLYMSLVPFHDRVNIGFNPSFTTGSAPSGWEGCVKPREVGIDGVPWRLTDAKPTGSDKFDHAYESDGTGLGDRSGGAACGDPITGPTNNPQGLITAAKAMSNSGTGRFDVGMAWAWRLLSPEWFNKWGTPHYPTKDTDDRKKYLVFISDGNTEAATYELNKGRSWGHNQGSVELFENLTYVCEGIKNDDIEIFVLQVSGNPHATSYFQNCASTSSHYFQVMDVDDIDLAFSSILKRFSNELRLTY